MLWWWLLSDGRMMTVDWRVTSGENGVKKVKQKATTEWRVGLATEDSQERWLTGV